MVQCDQRNHGGTVEMFYYVALVKSVAIAAKENFPHLIVTSNKCMGGEICDRMQIRNAPAEMSKKHFNCEADEGAVSQTHR
jgi:hypothetical protein